MARTVLFRHEHLGKVTGVFAGVVTEDAEEGVVATSPSLHMRLDRSSGDAARHVMREWAGIWTQTLGRSVENPTPEELNPPILGALGLPPMDQLVGRTLAVQTSEGEVQFRIGGVASYPAGSIPTLNIYEQVGSVEDDRRIVYVRLPDDCAISIPNGSLLRIPSTTIRLLD